MRGGEELGAMSRSILLPFVAPFHQEAAIIGRLLAGYTTLELGLMNCGLCAMISMLY